MKAEEIKQLNKELHELLKLEWHEVTTIGKAMYACSRMHHCSCGKNFFPDEIDDHLENNSHDFTSDAGRIELLRIIEGKEWYVDFLYRDDFTATKVLAKSLGAMESVLDINVSILTEQSGEHKLCCAVRDFLKGEK